MYSRRNLVLLRQQKTKTKQGDDIGYTEKPSDKQPLQLQANKISSSDII